MKPGDASMESEFGQHHAGVSKSWILDDVEGVRQRVVSEAGYAVARSDRVFALLDRSALDRTLIALRLDRPSLLWVVLYTPGTPRGDRRDKLAANVVCQLVHLQLTNGCDVVLEGRPKLSCLVDSCDFGIITRCTFA